MAALVAGVQYGLSSHSNFHENKSLIFVKLTDSAQRAIEDYLKNRNKTSQSPTIQFLGNEGQLSFPSSQSNHGSTGFTFSLSSNHDIEGPQGGFECVQQTGPKSLESLGTLPCKMRIQANDDVYETTRHRMAVAEENSKNKCTRVIKANGPDIGRKIKVKATGRTIPPPPPTTTSSSSLLSSSSSSSLSSLSSTNVRHRESLSIPTNVSQSSRLNYNLNTSSTMSSSTITPSLSSSLSNSSHKSMGTNNNPPLRMQQSKKLSELMRRPLKERLIHVLALRPYKKPELYDRITREGIKERDRSTMTTILKQVAYMHDNTYHLHLYIWNDIQEDWPFYSEQDRAMLKRRKPQNLTPPGSSDGSSGSGQSPNSMHPGSPPAIIAPPPSLINSKRPGYYQGNDGLQTKRPRISHYRKPEPTTRTSAGSSNSNSTNNNNTNINSGHGLSGNMSTSSMITSNETANWEHQQQSRQHQRDRSDYRIEKIERTERTANSDVLRGSYTTIAKPCLTPTSDCDENVVNNNNNNNNNNNKNNGNRYGNISSSSSSSSAAAAAAAAAASSSSSLSSTTTVSSCYNSTSINSNNNLYNSGIPSTTTTRYNSNVPNGNDKVSSVVNSGNCVGAGVFDYMRSFGGNINKNINNNSVSVGGGGGSSSSINNGGNNRGFGASPCNSGVIEARRGIGDFRDGRNNDKERGGDREKRELINKNIGSATGGINSYKINDSSANYGVCNNYIDSNENNSSSVAATVPTTPTTATATTTTTITGSSIIPTPVSPTVTSSNAKTSEYPDYLTQYTAINNTEQRRRYKAEFNSYYEEYRRLHTEVAKVSKRFAHLEELRQRELEIGNSAKGLELRAQIVAEYMSTKNDPAHIETKKCFHYLHEKLSHIKRLVLEYDTQHYGVTTSDDMSNNCNDILSGSGDLRY